MLAMSKDMTNLEVAELLRQVAAALTAKGDDFFRIKAYENAAASIEHETSSLRDLWQEGQLSQVPGLGKSLIEHLDELFKTGRVKHFDEMTLTLPMGMFELLDVPGIGPKTAFKLARDLKLTDPKTAKTKLLKAAKAGEIDKLPGFGVETQKEIEMSLNQKPQDTSRMLMIDAERLADEVVEYLRLSKHVIAAEPVGSLRRKSATVGDIDISVATDHPEEVMAHLKKFPRIKKTLAAGDRTMMFIHSLGREIDVKLQDPKAWGAVLQHFTGSKMHNIHLRKLALKKGMSLSEDGVKQKGKTVPYSTEEEFYHAIGMDYVPPELREDTGEIEAAVDRRLPKLVSLADIKGDLHVHSNIDVVTSHDEGVDSLDKLIGQAVKLGYEYLGIADHNPRSSEITEKRRTEVIRKRNELIEQQIYSYEKREKQKLWLKVLKGMEVDIKPDGVLALSDIQMADLDYVIASIHSSFGQDTKTATERVLAGLDHPKVKIWGHPSGRMIQEREGLDYDWDAVFEFCVKRQILVEINGYPNRLDLSENLIRLAKNAGVKMIINTDSHAVDQMQYMRYGVYNARRGWAEPKDIVNTLPWDLFRKNIDS